MSFLLDTHILLWYLIEPKRLSLVSLHTKVKVTQNYHQKTITFLIEATVDDTFFY